MSFQTSKYQTIIRDIPHYIHPPNDERAFLPSFGLFIRCRASLTIEAALVLPVFLFFVACMIHFLLLISLQSHIQLHLDEAARQIGKRAYIADESEILSLISSNSFTIRAEVLTGDLPDRINASRIQDGTSGFSTFLSSYDKSSSELDVVATYEYTFPYIPERIASFRFLQRSLCRAWTGEPLSKAEAEDEVSGEGRIVYITPAGRAWHATPQCHYLDLSIRPVSIDIVSSLRNDSGGRYGRCKCVTDTEMVYITNYGILYHSDITCYALKRTVMAVDISEVGSRHPCKKCAADEAGGS